MLKVCRKGHEYDPGRKCCPECKAERQLEANMTPEQIKSKREYQRERRANMTPEQRDREAKKANKRYHERRDNMAPEQLERERADDRVDNLSSEQRQRKHDNNQKRLYVGGMYCGMVGFTKNQTEEMLSGASK